MTRRLFWLCGAMLATLVACGHSTMRGFIGPVFPSASPSATPLATPTPTPLPGAVVPSVGNIFLSAPGQSATFTVTQQNFSGTYSAVSSNSTVASVAPGSAAASFVVTAGTTPGTVTITVTGAPGQPTGAVAITVTITQGVVQ